MDLSKLPRLSKTETPAPTPEAPAATEPPAAAPGPGPVRRGAFCDRCGAALRPGARFCDGCGTPVAASSTPVAGYASAHVPDGGGGGIAMDVWFSLVIGLVFLLLGRGVFSDLAQIKGPHPTNLVWSEGTPKANQPVTPDELQPDKRKEYDAGLEAERQQALTDGSMFLFGVALLVDAGTRLLVWLGLPGRRMILALGILVMLAAVAFNVYTISRLMRAGITPLLSLICVAFGGYVLFTQWITFRTTPAGRAPVTAM
jgi:zinc-ribbon domain